MERAPAQTGWGPSSRTGSAGQPAGQQLLAHLGALAAVGLGAAEQIGQFGVARAFGVLDVDVQAEGVVQACLDVPDEVVVLVLRASDVAGLGSGGHRSLLVSSASDGCRCREDGLRCLL